MSAAASTTESASAHTPGPWHSSQLRTHGADPRFNGCDIGAANNANVAIVHFNDRDMPQAEVKANARLIAAAPDLLTVAIQYRQTIKFYIGVDVKNSDHEGANLKRLALQEVEAALAKVEGRS